MITAMKNVLTTLDDVMVGQEFIACLKDVLAEVTVRIEIARGRVYLARYLDTDFQVSAALFDQLNAVQQVAPQCIAFL